MLNTYSSLNAVELNYNDVIEPEINLKQFRLGKNWNVISICTSYAKMRQHGNQEIG